MQCLVRYYWCVSNLNVQGFVPQAWNSWGRKKGKGKKKKGVRSEGFGKNRKASSLFVFRPNFQVSFTTSQAGMVLIWKHISNPGIWGLENNGVCLGLKTLNCPFWAEIRSKRKWKQKLKVFGEAEDPGSSPFAAAVEAWFSVVFLFRTRWRHRVSLSSFLRSGSSGMENDG